jgi:hypothetical protein
MAIGSLNNRVSKMNKKPYLILFLSLFITACASNNNVDQYYWGKYETLIYNNVTDSSDITTQTQILATDIEKAKHSGKRVAPGMHAHLGYLYSMQGLTNESKAALLEETRLYPESKTFIYGMLKRHSLGTN